jgi:hypothetical protein
MAAVVGIEAVCWKIVPRVSLAKYRVPVPPGVCGSAIDWNALAGAADVGWLHAEVVEPMSMPIRKGWLSG